MATLIRLKSGRVITEAQGEAEFFLLWAAEPTHPLGSHAGSRCGSCVEGKEMVTTNTPTVTVEQRVIHCGMQFMVVCSACGEVPIRMPSGATYTYPFQSEAREAAQRHERQHRPEVG